MNLPLIPGRGRREIREGRELSGRTRIPGRRRLATPARILVAVSKFLGIKPGVSVMHGTNEGPSQRSGATTVTTRTPASPPERYKWVALSNTTLAISMATIDGSIVIIALPAIFRGIHLNPFAPGNISYLLWLIMGYLLVQAVLVVSLGRLGDMFGRVRIYNLGFAVFAAASVLLSFDPFSGSGGALWLIGWRVVQAVGGAMLMANSAAILTDAFPARQRGMALGINQVAGISGQFIGLLLGGLLAQWDWRAVFWVSVPVGLAGTIWSYRSLREIATTRRARIYWAGNLTFAIGAGALLVAITYGIQPYGGHPTGWTNPWVLAGLIGGASLLVLFGFVETRVAAPMFRMALFKSRACAAGNAAALLGSTARGGLQFMLVIWLAGIWLPLHGYNYADTPLWAGIYMLPLTAGFLLAGPVSGYLSDRFGQRRFATAGLLVVAAAFIGLMLLPADFPYWAFALILFGNGIGNGLFASPNTSAIMSSVPARERGVASGMRSTFQNSGMSLSIGIFFSLMVIGLASALPAALTAGLTAQGVPAAAAARVAHLPPVSALFAALLGYNPIRTMLGPTGVLHSLPAANVTALTGRQFFPQLISSAFHHGLVIVFSAAAAMALIGALVSFLRGGRFYYDDPDSPPAPVAAEQLAGAARAAGAAHGAAPVSGGPMAGRSGAALRLLGPGWSGFLAVIFMAGLVLPAWWLATPFPGWLPGLGAYPSAYIGDTALLPAGCLILLLGIRQLPPVSREKAAVIVSAGLAAALSVAMQAEWLDDPTTQLNWTMPRVGYFNAAGWWHAGYTTAMSAIVIGLIALFVARVRAARLAGRKIAGELSSGTGAAIALTALGSYAALVARDDFFGPIRRSAATSLGLVAFAFLLAGLLIWFAYGRLSVVLASPALVAVGGSIVVLSFAMSPTVTKIFVGALMAAACCAIAAILRDRGPSRPHLGH